MFGLNSNNGQSNENQSVIETNQINILDQTVPHEACSEKYLTIPTREILDVFEELGFSYNEDSLWTSKSRKTSRIGKGKHMITLRHPDLQVAKELRNELIPQMYLWNSYDRSIQLKIIIGFWRMVCENRMAVGSGIVDPITFKHIAGLNNKQVRKNQLIQSVQNAADKFKAVSEYVLSLKDVTMTKDEKLEFARRMVEIRLVGTSEEATLQSKGIEITKTMLEESILNPNRIEDVGDSAWLVANVVQENLVSPRNFARFSYVKTYVNSKQETVRKDKNARELKNRVRIDSLNTSLFQELNNVVGDRKILIAA
jgi:hypothetical protein